MHTPTFADIEDAAGQIEGLAIRTPLLHSEALDDATGARVFVKAEPLQRTGSFKFRGAVNRIFRLSADERARGVVAYSSGNHAQAVAEASTLAGVRSVIVMPADAPRLKIEATRGYGAEVVLYDRTHEVREDVAARVLAEHPGATLVPPFEDPFIIAGQGTAALEALQSLKDLGVTPDAVLSPASGGGLMAGTALAFEALAPQARRYAVEPSDFDDMARSIASGRRETNARTSGGLCDALLTPTPGEMTFSINQPRLAGVLTVTDAEVLHAMAFAFRWLKLVVEPGGCVALAAALAGKLDLKGQAVVIIASGGNVDPDVFARALAVPL
jgi:threonine dehydratase